MLNAQPLVTWSSAQSEAQRTSSREAADRFKTESVVMGFSMQGHVEAKTQIPRLIPRGLFTNPSFACGVGDGSSQLITEFPIIVGGDSLCGFHQVVCPESL